jgi:hypothetical protein
MTHVAEQPRVGPRWFPLNVWTALVLATVFGLLTFLLTSTGESVTQAADTAETAIVQLAAGNDAAPAATSSDGSSQAVPQVVDAEASSAPFRGVAEDSAAARSHPLVARAGAITNMGPTEVGYATNFPSASYTWQRIELPGAGTYDQGWLGELNGQIVSVSPAWDEDAAETQSLITRASPDAIEWEQLSSYQLPPDTWVSRVDGSNGLVVAIGERWTEGTGQAEHLVHKTTDGITWTESPLALEIEDGENAYIQNMAVGAAGIVLAVQLESYPEQQPLILVFETHELLLDHMRGSFSLTDLESGEVVLTGSTDEIFNWGGEGQNIYNPETGELLTVIPYEVWERAYNEFYMGGAGGSPLPIPVPGGEPTGETAISIEYDGFVVTVDERAGTYSVADASSGDDIATGPVDYLYQGPPPTFQDQESGEVILAVTWDEWYRAEEQSYIDVEYGSDYHEYLSKTALVTSTDGDTWEMEIVSTSQGGSSSFLVATDDGFVARVNAYSEGGEQSTVWTMSGGEWTVSEAARSDLWLYQVTPTADGLVGVGDGSGGPALWSSPDGVSWTSEFAILPQNDGSYAWMSDVTNDGAGTIGALAIREKYNEYTPLVIEQDKYTAIFEDGEYVLRVTETASGESVLSLGWEEFEEGSTPVTYADGATSIDLGNGDVMVISDEESYAAMETRYASNGQLGLSVFLNDGTGWAEAVVEVEGGMSGPSELFLADSNIVIAGSHWGMERSYRYEEPIENSFVIIVGTPVGG